MRDTKTGKLRCNGKTNQKDRTHLDADQTIKSDEELSEKHKAA